MLYEPMQTSDVIPFRTNFFSTTECDNLVIEQVRAMYNTEKYNEITEMINKKTKLYERIAYKVTQKFRNLNSFGAPVINEWTFYFNKEMTDIVTVSEN